MKTCSKCKQVLPLALFYKMSISKDGFRPSCKACDLMARDKNNRRKYEQVYWATRKEIKAAIVKKSTSNNKDHHAAVLKTYRSTERFKLLHANDGSKRRARIRKAFVEFVDYREVYNESGGLCFYCGKTLNFKDVEFDHYIPIAKGGPHVKNNIKCSCQYCNRSKGAKLPGGVGYQVV